MEWTRESVERIVSNTEPQYKVIRFRVDGKSLFRAVYRNEFIGMPRAKAQAAMDICENHHTITQEAKEVSNDPKE
jgi:hypothetical protein